MSRPLLALDSGEQGPDSPAMERLCKILCVAVLVLAAGRATASNVRLPPAKTTEGYLCRLLLNEVPFPGERGYRSEKDTVAAMNALLYVLNGRLRNVPSPYTQKQVAGVKADDIIDVITAGGERGQFDGFYRDAGGKPAMVKRVGERIDYLMKIGNEGSPGRFAGLLNHAVDLSTGYVAGRLDCPNRHAGVKKVQGIPATGGAYSWMTDMTRYHPGGNFLRIPDDQYGGLGGNRFFTLRQNPK